ncbi:MAG: FkbM family methyltransferase [Acidimicrobiales bacterium]|nr:FkbM family methyltransferase [Acidimicrobiales bacterium]
MGLGRAYVETRRFFSRTYRRDQRDKSFLTALVTFALDEVSNVVDVGANEGELLDLFVCTAPGGDHWAFEPIAAHADDLRRRFPSVTVRQVALSDQDGVAPFVAYPAATSYSSFWPQPHARRLGRPERLMVEIHRLDTELPPDYCPQMIKIDAEGAEWRILQGSAETLERCRPIVVFEFYRATAIAGGATAESVHSFFSELGYRLHSIEGGEALTLRSFEDHFLAGRLWMFVAIHRG